MTPSDSLAIKLVSRPKKVVSFSLRLIWAIMVLAAVCLAWLFLFLLFLPFLLVALLISNKSLNNSPDEPAEVCQGSPTARVADTPSTESHLPMIFDRRRDISKLFGCNTRNVQYRWQIFASKLQQLRKNVNSPEALDFGAGSLRDSYELARLGFCVTSVDLDPHLLQHYYQSYDWSMAHCPPKLHTETLEMVKERAGYSPFQLAIAFDVIEHLEDPSSYCRRIYSLLDEGGLFFTIVPNKRSIFERYFKRSVAKHQARGLPLVPGVPHLQFKLPSEWEQLFEESGFTILEHDMAIGFFVNDCWNGLLGLPLRVYVTPVFERVAILLRASFDPGAFEQQFSPRWLMKGVDVLDQLVKRQFASRFGWNLIVAERSRSTQAA